MSQHSTSTLSIPGIDELEPIGRGGFGTVYSGWQEALHRKVAVKVLNAVAVGPGAARRLQREGMAMGALSHHPNVVPVYETGTVDERLYLVMPLLADGSLADQLESGPLAATEVVELGRGLADALATAHEAGVLHRDVKPANVLRTSHGTYQLADFGVARFVDTTQTLGGLLVATIAYAAPEVLDGRPATAASDVYSLGATLHAALRGRAPFESGPDDAPVALALRVLTTPPPDLRATGVPSALAEVVERAMAREPADRYPSAAALRDALERARSRSSRSDGVPRGRSGAMPPRRTAALPPALPTVAMVAVTTGELVPDGRTGSPTAADARQASPCRPRPPRAPDGGRRRGAHDDRPGRDSRAVLGGAAGHRGDPHSRDLGPADHANRDDAGARGGHDSRDDEGARGGHDRADGGPQHHRSSP